jgi:hypothetical protein
MLGMDDPKVMVVGAAPLDLAQGVSGVTSRCPWTPIAGRGAAGIAGHVARDAGSGLPPGGRNGVQSEEVRVAEPTPRISLGHFVVAK